MQRAILVIAFFIAVSAHAGDGYLIIDAVKLPTTTRQPTWIGLVRNGKIKVEHIATKQAVVKVPAGHYRVHHYDFAETRNSPIGTMFSWDNLAPSFDVEENAISYVGELQLTVNRGSRLDTRFSVIVQHPPAMLSRACQEKPELFEQLPVTIVNGDGSTQRTTHRCTEHGVIP